MSKSVTARKLSESIRTHVSALQGAVGKRPWSARKWTDRTGRSIRVRQSQNLIACDDMQMARQEAGAVRPC